MRPRVSKPNAPSLIDLGKKPARREAVSPSNHLPSGPLVDLGKKDGPRVVRPSSAKAPNHVVQVALVWLGLAAFGAMLWAFYAARNPAVVTPEANTAPATSAKTADPIPQPGVAPELSSGAEFPSNYLKASPAENAQRSPMTENQK